MLYTYIFRMELSLKKDLFVGELNDFYGALLTSRQRETLTSYFDYDLSLSEIAENEGVTRQAVHDVISKAIEQLNAYENVIGACGLKKRVIETVSASIEKMTDGKLDEAISDLERLLGDL